MQWIVDSWTLYYDWASNLDSESRLYLIAGSLLLISMYAMLNVSPADSSQKSLAPSKINRRGNDWRK